MSRSKEANDIVNELSVKGWTLIRGKCHWKALSPGGAGIVVFAITPSDHRAIKNIRSDIKRIERIEQ